MTALTPAPTLRTDRLVLRGPERGDLAALTHWVTTSERMAMVGGNGTPAEARFAFVANIGRWHLDGFGFFTLTRHDDSAPLGRVGLLAYPPTPQEPRPATELAWHLFDGAEGQGLASEAARAIRDWAGRDLCLGTLVSYIDPANVRSQAVARRLGATTDGTRAAHDAGAEVWAHATHAPGVAA